mgnify:CR=1 FL=1
MNVRLGLIAAFSICAELGASEHLSKKMDLKVSSKHDTLFAFSQGVIASNCQPATVVEFSAVSSGEAVIENYLQLHPFGKASSVSCSIKLENDELYQLNLMLDEQVKTPFVDFSLKRTQSDFFQDKKAKAFVALMGSEVEQSYIKEQLPRNAHRISKKNRYSLRFMGQTGELKGFILQIHTPAESFRLAPAPLGAIHYSAIHNQKLYVLSQSMMSWDQLRTLLP